MDKPPSADWSIRSVVFDLDGLLIDTEGIFAEVTVRLVRRRGQELDPAVFPLMMGTPAREAIPMLKERHGLSDSVDDLNRECSELFAEILGQEPVRLLPGAVALLDHLAERRVPRAIATSSSANYVNRVLGPHQLVDRFDFVLTCDDVQHGKPHPEIYEKAAQRLGNNPANVLVLEDSPNGMRAAKAAGARCIVVPHALVPVHELDQADAVLSSLEDERLLQWIS